MYRRYSDGGRRSLAREQNVVGRSGPAETAVPAAEERRLAVGERDRPAQEHAERRAAAIQRRARRPTATAGVDRAARARDPELCQIAQERRIQVKAEMGVVRSGHG